MKTPTLFHRMQQVELFPGNLGEYALLKGANDLAQPYQILDTNRREKYVFDVSTPSKILISHHSFIPRKESQMLESLLDQGMCALVCVRHFMFHSGHHGKMLEVPYGIPIRKSTSSVY